MGVVWVVGLVVWEFVVYWMVDWVGWIVYGVWFVGVFWFDLVVGVCEGYVVG